MEYLDSKAVIQVGLVVRDIKTAVKNYASIFNIDEPEIRNVFPNITYRGQEVRPVAKICVFVMGAVAIELVEPDDTASSWKEFLDTRGEGVHNLGIVVEDLDSAMHILKSNNIPIRQSGGAGWGSYTLVDSEEKLGVVFNIKCNKPIE